MLIIHSIAHHVIIIPKFTFANKKSIWGEGWLGGGGEFVQDALGVGIPAFDLC